MGSGAPAADRLSPRVVQVAAIYLHCERFGCDTLLIVADYFADAGIELELRGYPGQALHANDLAYALRAEAPRRVQRQA